MATDRTEKVAANAMSKWKWEGSWPPEAVQQGRQPSQDSWREGADGKGWCY